MSLLVLGLVPGSASSALADCYRPNCWGAIAIGTSNGAWAWVVNHPSSGSARSRALYKCNGRCNRVLVFRNSCAAYAVAYNGGWGWSRNYSNRAGAVRRALYECRRYNPGRGCRLRVWACTSR
jgi:hypothetical protein